MVIVDFAFLLSGEILQNVVINLLLIVEVILEAEKAVVISLKALVNHFIYDLGHYYPRLFVSRRTSKFVPT
jgi:hypothetical protein